MLEDIPVV